MTNDELTPAEYRSIIRSQQSHIEKLRGMLWIAAAVDEEDDKPLTQADFDAALALPPESQIINMIADLESGKSRSIGG
jgi:hypothetical protein